MAVSIKKGRALESVSITPLIDIVFLLLIFFLVATRFAEEDRELDVELPSASEAMPMTVKPKEIFINIDKEGKYYMGSKYVKLEELEERLEVAGRNNPTNQSVTIRADKNCKLDYAVQAMNACKKARVEYVLTTAGDEG